jgi:uncharacterized protein YodC (DUF2158 family)
MYGLIMSKFKVGDVVVENDINVDIFRMTVEVIFPTDTSDYEYQCAYFELGELKRDRFKEVNLLFEQEFILKRISEDRNLKIDKLLLKKFI